MKRWFTYSTDEPLYVTCEAPEKAPESYSNLLHIRWIFTSVRCHKRRPGRPSSLSRGKRVGPQRRVVRPWSSLVVDAALISEMKPIVPLVRLLIWQSYWMSLALGAGLWIQPDVWCTYPKGGVMTPVWLQMDARTGPRCQIRPMSRPLSVEAGLRVRARIISADEHGGHGRFLESVTRLRASLGWILCTCKHSR